MFKKRVGRNEIKILIIKEAIIIISSCDYPNIVPILKTDRALQNKSAELGGKGKGIRNIMS